MTDRIVEMIEAGTAPWQRPWDRARHPSAPAFPVNAATGKTYRGVNVLLLGADPRTSDDPRWCGYEQAKARGWQVRGGVCGATIYFFKRLEIPEAGEADAEPPLDEDGRPLCLSLIHIEMCIRDRCVPCRWKRNRSSSNTPCKRPAGFMRPPCATSTGHPPG